eukprot:GSA120T00016502001.1
MKKFDKTACMRNFWSQVHLSQTGIVAINDVFPLEGGLLLQFMRDLKIYAHRQQWQTRPDSAVNPWAKKQKVFSWALHDLFGPRFVPDKRGTILGNAKLKEELEKELKLNREKEKKLLLHPVAEKSVSEITNLLKKKENQNENSSTSALLSAAKEVVQAKEVKQAALQSAKSLYDEQKKPTPAQVEAMVKQEAKFN